MDENNRAVQRVRPKPYDLRRKVLLKNFLREQMTYIPPFSRGPSDNSRMNSPISNGDQDADTSMMIDDEENSNYENESSPSFQGVQDDCTTASTSIETDQDPSVLNGVIASPAIGDENTTKKIRESKLRRISKLLTLKRIRENRRRGISKAKYVYKPVRSNSLRSPTTNTVDEDILTKADPKPKKITFFSVFRSKRDVKKPDNTQILKKLTPFLRKQSRDMPCTSVSQSCQTDISYTQEEFNKMEESNRQLREENRLLSESLSYIMSDVSHKMSPQTTNGSYNCPSNSQDSFSLYDISASNTPTNSNSDKKSTIIKLSRSHSLQDRTVRRTGKICLRTKSMNQRECPNIKSSESQQRFFQTKEIGFNQRSNFANEGRPRRRLSVLRSLPINDFGRSIVRRSSMPERPHFISDRPVMRRNSTNMRDYNHTSFPLEWSPFDIKHRWSDNTPRPISVRDYNRSDPLLALPSEAFY